MDDVPSRIQQCAACLGSRHPETFAHDDATSSPGGDNGF